MGGLLLSVLGGFTVWSLISPCKAQWEEGKSRRTVEGKVSFLLKLCNAACLPASGKQTFSFFHVLKLIWEFVKGDRQPALRNEILRMVVKQAELSSGGGNWKLPSHPPLPIHCTRDHFWGTKMSVMPPGLSIVHQLCCYHLLNSKALMSHSGTLGGGKIRTTMLSGVAISTSIESLTHGAQS